MLDDRSKFNLRDETSLWSKYDCFLHEKLIKSLKSLYGDGPTQIQQCVLDSLAKCKDMNRRNSAGFVIASKTGTGKTMAYSIPILNRLLINKNIEKPPKKIAKNVEIKSDELNCTNLNNLLADHLYTEKFHNIFGLIISPSRELCIQIKKHLENVLISIDYPIRVLSLTGGLSQVKQHELLIKEPDIIVGTPGRILDFAKFDTKFANSLKHLKCLVFDEADKLFDPASFSEIKIILNFLKEQGKQNDSDDPLQIFVASATLYSINGTQDSNTRKYLKTFLKRSKINHNHIHHINLIDNCAIPSLLQEFKIFCIDSNKDLYLLYLLKNLNLKSCMIFVNSKDKIKLLCEKLELYGYKDCVFSLSSALNQRQRLKNLRNFTNFNSLSVNDKIKEPLSILLTTDLSSRGFDIENINSVIHYDVPSSHETYIHRCGRTARNNSQGSSYLLLGAEDFIKFKELSKYIGSNSKKLLIPNSKINCFKKQSDTIINYINLKRHKIKIEEDLLKSKTCDNWQRYDILKNKLININSQLDEVSSTMSTILT